ncbi:MAG: hypothetical protein K2K91_05205 [Ruminococcus sp.]|nr:hypothetical protein [Ruminococcus sp.]
MLNMTYALKEGILTSIEDVESGLKCNCYCLSCGALLEAHKGTKKAHHFQHHNSIECKYGYETSLHMLAKSIIEKEMNLVIPEVTFNFKTGDYEVRSYPAQSIKFDYVELEKRINNIIPDIVLHYGNKTLIVEIFVTHKIDKVKLEKIKARGISTIEIDLSKADRNISEDDLKRMLTTDCAEKRWIFNRYVDNVYKYLIHKAQKFPIIERGFALHVDYCPIKSRYWRGKPYANVVDDCSCCKYCLEIEHEQEKYDFEYDYPKSIAVYCLGKI